MHKGLPRGRSILPRPVGHLADIFSGMAKLRFGASNTTPPETQPAYICGPRANCLPRTCSLDDTCVLCSKCFESSSHEGHAIYVSISTSNRGCCDCGDQDAWKQPIRCAIHTVLDRSSSEMDTDIDSIPLPPELILSIRSTISRALYYICDVISCSPEQLRLEKTEKKIRYDEAQSRLMSKYYGDSLEPECLEYALVIWNDEKHTETEVREQIRRACKQTMELVWEKSGL
jgi:E3 ubiquitin-protein ligase UBR1